MFKMSLPLKLRGGFALLGASLTIALFGTMVHQLRPMFGTAMQAVIRALLAAVIMGIVMIILHRKPQHLTRADWLKTVVVGSCGSITLVLFAIVALHDKAASATFLVFAGSMLTALAGGMIWLGEKVTIVRLAAAGLAIGGLLVYANGFTYTGLVTILGILAGVSDGVANVLRKQMRHIDRSTAVMYQYAIGSATALFFVLGTQERPIIEVQVMPILVMIVFAVLALNLGALLLYGFGHVDIQTGAVLSSMQIFFAVVLGFIFLHQIPTGNEIVGCFLIGAASCLAVFDMQKASAALQRLRLRHSRVEANSE